MSSTPEYDWSNWSADELLQLQHALEGGDDDTDGIIGEIDAELTRRSK
jgi:hypothetical protein